MKLLELCRPIFDYVAAFKRSVKAGSEMSADTLRAELKKIFEKMKSEAAKDPDLDDQYEKVELPLIFFVDFVVLESHTKLARFWDPLAEERNELAGDQKFFEMLEATLADESDKASERLVVYHMCLGLGFTGGNDDAPGTEGGRAYLSFVGAGSGKLDVLKRRTYNRVRKALDIKATEHLCPQAYEHVDRGVYTDDWGRKLLAMAVTLAGLICLLVIVNFFLFRYTSNSITTVLEHIKARSGSPVSTAPVEAGSPSPAP
jgi:type VI secretion system protein ImpK